MAYGRNQQIETALSYIHGRLEAQIEAYAESLGIAKSDLATRLAALLLPAGRAAGAAHPVPGMRNSAARSHPPMGALEVDERAPDGGPRGGHGSGKAKRNSSGIRAYWDAMTPKERSAEMARRAAKGLGRGSSFQKTILKKAKGKGWGKAGRPSNAARAARAAAAAKRTQPAKAAKASKGPRSGPKAAQRNAKGMRSFWAKMTPEQRAAEIKRRQQVTAAKKTAWAKEMGQAS